jgi:hypothetical protein
MKNTGLKNPFPEDVRLLYLYVFACFNCSRSDRGIELHHIFGRISPAAFNAFPICRFCHHSVTNSPEERARFFFKNQEFLLEQRYKPKENDFEIIEKYPFLIETEYYKRLYQKKDIHY